MGRVSYIHVFGPRQLCVRVYGKYSLTWPISTRVLIVHSKGVKMNSNKINSYNEYVIIYYFMILRLISFSIDEIESRSGQNRGPIDFYSYILYPTVLTFAPFISFKKFLPCVIIEFVATFLIGAVIRMFVDRTRSISKEPGRT